MLQHIVLHLSFVLRCLVCIAIPPHICCSISCFICDVCSMSYAHSNSTSTYATAYRASSVVCFVMSCVLLTNNDGAAAPLSCHSCLCTTLLFSLPLSLSLAPSLSHCLSVSMHPVSLRSCEMCWIPLAWSTVGQYVRLSICHCFSVLMSCVHSNSPSTYAAAYRASSVVCVAMSCILLTSNHGAAAPLPCHSCLCIVLSCSLSSPLSRSLSLSLCLCHSLSVSLSLCLSVSL